jgi:hypothetical protein
MSLDAITSLRVVALVDADRVLSEYAARLYCPGSLMIQGPGETNYISNMEMRAGRIPTEVSGWLESCRMVARLGA